MEISERALHPLEKICQIIREILPKPSKRHKLKIMNKSFAKISFVAGASAGGELSELLELLKFGKCQWPIMPNYFVTTHNFGKLDLEKFSRGAFLLEGATRNQPLKIFKLLYKSFRFAIEMKPRILLTTGSLPFAALAFWSFLLGSTIIWIECSASLTSVSWSGRLVSLFAHRFYVQHPKLANSRRIYIGELA